MNADATFVSAVPKQSLTSSLLYKLNEEWPTIGILPTAFLAFSSRKATVQHPLLFVVPYSLHSPFTEILEFLKVLQFNSISGIIGDKSLDPRRYFPCKRKFKFKVPPCVTEAMQKRGRKPLLTRKFLIPRNKRGVKWLEGISPLTLSRFKNKGITYLKEVEVADKNIFKQENGENV
ncbi:5' exonuclease Apollo-like isoform X2 [Zophobas morio]|uniref:5' exonuclease Apollo-like isoform X2 n=1 Tax=Zophobas morio TaxID=2755281 RepID=UPI0030839205